MDYYRTYEELNILSILAGVRRKEWEIVTYS